MNYRFAVEWLKAFRDSSETVCKLYADDCLFEDLMLGQSIDNKDDLHRVFAPYANTDRTNGIGLHNFRVDEYVGNDNDGVISELKPKIPQRSRHPHPASRWHLQSHRAPLRERQDQTRVDLLGRRVDPRRYGPADLQGRRHRPCLLRGRGLRPGAER